MNTRQLLNKLVEIYAEYYADCQERFQETLHTYSFLDEYELGEVFLEDLIRHDIIDDIDFQEINPKLIALHAIEYLRLAA